MIIDFLARNTVHFYGKWCLKKLFTLFTVTTMEDTVYVLVLWENSVDMFDQEMKLKKEEMSFEEIKSTRPRTREG